MPLDGDLEIFSMAALSQSGDRVSISTISGLPAVVKTARRGNEGKLFLQYQLQKAYRVDMAPLRVPDILTDWDGVSFAMEYVSAMTLGQALEETMYSTFSQVHSKILSYLENQLGKAVNRSIGHRERGELGKKLVTLREGILFQPNLAEFLPALEATDSLMKNLNQLPFGPYHGDFSFENILVGSSGNDVWVVDFLPSSVATPIVDIARLLLDVETGWWRMAENESAAARLRRRRLEEDITSLYLAQGIDEDSLTFFRLLSILRIVPYTKSPLRLSYLIRGVRALV